MHDRGLSEPFCSDKRAKTTTAEANTSAAVLVRSLCGDHSLISCRTPPIEETLKPLHNPLRYVHQKLRLTRSVWRPGVDHHLRWYAAAPKRGIKLLTLCERHPKVVFPMDDLRRDSHVCDAVHRRVFLIGLVIIPELSTEVCDDVVWYVRRRDHADKVGKPRTHAGGLESISSCHEE